MSFLYYHFPISGVHTHILLPPLVMFFISTFLSMSGISGAFILLPFQMSVLGYTAPGVSGTNFVYNVISIPLGVYKYIRDKKLCWALFTVLIVSTVPGVFLGYYIRVAYLPDPAHFKPIVGVILGVLAWRVFASIVDDQRSHFEAPLPRREDNFKLVSSHVSRSVVTIVLANSTLKYSTWKLVSVSSFVGVVAGAYGLGGGALLAPFCIAVLKMPPSVVAGATLFSTWMTSVLGACLYTLVDLKKTPGVTPDWALGVLFGLGGMAGIYLGAKLQNKVPLTLIKIVLGLALVFISGSYLWPVVTAPFSQ